MQRYLVTVEDREHGSRFHTRHGVIVLDHENGTPLSDEQKAYMTEAYGASCEKFVAPKKKGKKKGARGANADDVVNEGDESETGTD